MEEKNHHHLLKEKFSQGAEEYDRQRKHVIPCLEDLYQVTSDLANVNTAKPRVLDLGAGTGLLTSYLHNRYPEGDFILLDLSEEMLKIARTRFENLPYFHYVVADYLEHELEGEFDIVVSSLSIHHLENHEKRFLYDKVYQHLNSGGLFINADQVMGPSPANEKEYYRNWLEKIEMGSLSESEKNTILDRMKLDKPASLADNLKWLEEIGFVDVDVYYKYYNFVVLYGKRIRS
ncbi:MAG: class I SAM-dependent methyltransferase [Methanobacterium sp.]|uniref:class I SAM-dependent methyltransferase n=1 Tax=unclassified Methanobacterium TaxID=2627676 RepID=UPI000C2D252A|nr:MULTISPECIES: class I SAM-dependent methyltransferase [unclassified Methanobacterium]AUB57602.1 methyltransferase type 12 [Methanobacterium sp. MZ-A1]MBW4256161.1 class I SAM-dependent methyltransferase [Methanobacterium sp. YSL]MCC7559684.1 class I SAM-dependent methyltransferase [Methanobacterium sp.]